MSATDPHHFVGQNVNNVDQVSSVVLLGLAVAGAVATVLLDILLIG